MFDAELLELFLSEAEKTDKDINREKRLRACCQSWSYTTKPNGALKCIIYLCEIFRICSNCRHQKYLKIDDRLHYAQSQLPVDQWLKFMRIDDSEGALLKKIKRHKGQHLRIPQPENLIIIHNALDIEDGEDLLDYEYLEHENDWSEDIQLEFNSLLQNVPEGKRITGSLGKPELPPDDSDGDGEDNYTYDDIKFWHLYKEGLTKREANIAYDKAVASTQNISVETFGDLELAMERRVRAMKAALGGGNDIDVYHHTQNISDKDMLSWNSNPNNGVVEIVQIARI